MLIKDRTKPIGWVEDEIDYFEEASTAKVAFVEDDTSEWSGLYNADGLPLYKQSPKIKLGYI